MPLPSARVIPTNWADHHLPTAQGSMTATVRLERADSDRKNDRAGYDPKRQRPPASGGTPAPAPTGDMVNIWEGPALVVAQTSQAQTRTVADQQVTTRTYAVSLPRSAPRPRAGDDGTSPGDRITVLTSPGDPGLTGAGLRVIDVAVASESFARDVICLYELGRNNPPLAAPATPTTPTPSSGG